MDEQLLNEYINNLANQVNSLNQENILLKTRLGIFEKREQIRLQEEQLVKERQAEQAEVPTEPQPMPQEQSTYSQPEPEPTPEPIVETPVEPEVQEPKTPMVRAPRPKGYNRRVDGPLPLIPDPNFENTES
jgi:outer membrane biosynthesis protein TonB